MSRMRMSACTSCCIAAGGGPRVLALGFGTDGDVVECGRGQRFRRAVECMRRCSTHRQDPCLAHARPAEWRCAEPRRRRREADEVCGSQSMGRGEARGGTRGERMHMHGVAPEVHRPEGGSRVPLSSLCVCVCTPPLVGRARQQWSRTTHSAVAVSTHPTSRSTRRCSRQTAVG